MLYSYMLYDDYTGCEVADDSGDFATVAGTTIDVLYE